MAGTASQVYVDGTPTNGANPWLDSLVSGGAWADTAGLSTTGGPVSISFAFVQNSSTMSWASYALSGVVQAMNSWEAVANVDFIQASSHSSADVWLWQLYSSQTGSGTLGWSEIPAYSEGEPLYWAGNGEHWTWSSTGLAVGGYGYITLIHELGHLLGLAHPHDGGYASDGANFPGVTSPYGDYGDYNLNQGIFTVMSYNDGWPSQFPGFTLDSSSVGYGWQATPMALDIAALQAI
jgi:serralysin